mgnify:CR=1 FL=1
MRALGETEARLTFVGHSHRAFVYQEDGGLVLAGEGLVDLKGRSLINVGSVGQPRYRDPRAAFCVWDTETEALDMIRVNYDLATTQQKILENHLPAFLAQRLETGS